MKVSSKKQFQIISNKKIIPLLLTLCEVILVEAAFLRGFWENLVSLITPAYSR